MSDSFMNMIDEHGHLCNSDGHPLICPFQPPRPIQVQERVVAAGQPNIQLVNMPCSISCALFHLTEDKRVLGMLQGVQEADGAFCQKCSGTFHYMPFKVKPKEETKSNLSLVE